MIFGYACVIYVILISANSLLIAQNKLNDYLITHDDSLALEKIIVEKYYVADSIDNKDTSANALPKNSITYRIFVDMKPGYKLQMVYGDKKHELFFETTTKFYNNNDADAITGFNVDLKKISTGNIALDSWITLGAACRGFTGIPREEDTSRLSLITNRSSLAKSDGLTKAVLPDFQLYNLDLTFFNIDSTAKRFSTINGAWEALGGVVGPTPENRVLIAQLTTNGKLTFQINVQIGTPTKGYVKLVAGKAEDSEIMFDGLNYI